MLKLGVLIEIEAYEKFYHRDIFDIEVRAYLRG